MRGVLEKAKADVMAAALVSFLFASFTTIYMVGYGWEGFAFFMLLFSTLFFLNIVVVVLYHAHYLHAGSFLYLFAFALAAATLLIYFPTEVMLFLTVVADVLFFTAAMLLAEGKGHATA